MANPVVASSSKAGGTSTATYSPALPTGTVSGDLLLAFCHSDENTSTVAVFTPPDGSWTALTTVIKGGATAGASAQAFYKYADGTEASTLSFTRTNNTVGNWGVIAARITGVDTSTPINTYATAVYASGDDGTSPSVTTTVDECLIIRFSTWNESKTIDSIPDGTTAVQHNDLSSNDGHMLYENQATAGATGSKVYRLSSATQTANFTIAFQPPQGGGGLTNGFKVWNGSAWTVKPVKVWNGSVWSTKTLKRWNGSAWIDVEY